MIVFAAFSFIFLVGVPANIANSVLLNQTCPTCNCPPPPVCPPCPAPTVIQQAPAPIPVATGPSTVSALNPLSLPSPSTDADLETILNYLLKRGGRLDGAAWSSEAMTTLQNKTVWTGGGGTGSTRIFTYPQGTNTQHTWQIFYDDASGRWNLKSIS
jgi:hypothetical protein